MTLISKLKPAFYMNFSVSLHSQEENATQLISLEPSEGEKPYLSLDVTENNLTLKYSNVSLEIQVNDPAYFYVEISQLYIGGKVQTIQK